MTPKFLAESDKGMLWEPRVVESGREMVEGFKEDEKGKSFCFVVIQSELIFRHPCFYVVCACIEFIGEVGHLNHWEKRISGAVCHLKKADGLQSG